MSAAGILACCTGCANGTPCTGVTLKKNCAGFNYLRTSSSFSGSAAGTASRTQHIPIADANQYLSVVDCSWSIAWDVSNVQLEQPSSSSTLLVGFVEGKISFDQDGNEVYNTLAPFGTVTATASGNFSISDDAGTGGGESGSGTFVSLGYSIEFAASIVVTAAGLATFRTSVNASFGMGAATPVNPPDGPSSDGVNSGPYIPYGIVGIFSQTSTETIDTSAICLPSAISMGEDGGTLDGNSYIGASYPLERDDDTEDSDWDGSASGTAEHMTDDVAESDTTLLATDCPRFFNVTSSQIQSVATDDADATFGTLTARVVMPAVGRCSQFPSQWDGFGDYTFTNPINSNPVRYAAIVTVRTIVSGPLETISSLSQSYLSSSIGVSAGTPTGGSIVVTTSSGSTSPLSPTMSAATLESALAAITPAGQIVRVTRFDVNDSDVAYGHYYSITGAPNAPSISVASTVTGVTVTSSNGGVTAGRSIAFKTTTVCPSGSVTLVKTPGTGVTPDYTPGLTVFDGESIAFSATTRIDGDPIYYCDCGPNCTTVGSSMALKFISPAVGANAAINEAFAISKIASTPCNFAVTYTVTTGPAIGDEYTVLIIVDANGRYTLTVRDDEDSVILVAYATCEGGKTLPNLTWKVDHVAGSWAPYTAMVVTTS